MLKYGNKDFLNLEEQVAKNQADIERLQTGVKIEKWLLDSQLASYVTEENVGKYYLVYRDSKDYLYIITHRDNGGLIAENLGEYPKAEKGDQGIPGVQGPKGDKGDRGIQGLQGIQGAIGLSGAGWNSLSSIDSTDYTPTFTTEDNIIIVETNADLITNEGTADEETKVISFKFEIPDQTDSYSAGDGITISSNTVSAKVGKGLEFNSEDKSIQIDTTVVATKTDLAGKQNLIDSSHKLNADLVDDSNKANRFLRYSNNINIDNEIVFPQLILGEIKAGTLPSFLSLNNYDEVLIEIERSATELPNKIIQTITYKNWIGYRMREYNTENTNWSAWIEIDLSAIPTVSQTTGSSTTSVMSQNAVTTALGNKADKAITESYTISAWTALSSSEPFTYSATVTATATIGNNTTVELLNDNAVLFATYGFAIGSISGQSITIYSIGQPDSSVSLTMAIGG